NPISQEYTVMRNSLLPGLLETLSRNINRGNDEIGIFEIGKTFSFDKSNIIHEKSYLCILLRSHKRKSWIKNEEIDFYYFKGMVAEMLEKLFLEEISFKKEKHPVFYPGMCAAIMHKTKRLALVGALHPRILATIHQEERVYCLYLDLEKTQELQQDSLYYEPVSKYPASTRDLAIVIDKHVAVGDIDQVIKKVGSSLLESVDVFDVYQGDQIPEEKKSVAFSLRFRSLDDTLNDESVDMLLQQIRKKLIEEIGCDFR
ncbi:hypothetical protein ACFL1T_05080, partial [Chlamydiota bacterium]